MELYRALKYADPDNSWHFSSIYRWNYPREKGGCGGVIPNSAYRAIFKAARLSGVILRAEDFLPKAF
jgi:hypothetical protein